jgi:hypothetical protein
MVNLVTGDTKQRTGIAELETWLLHGTCLKSQLLQTVCMQLKACFLTTLGQGYRRINSAFIYWL